MSFPSSPFPFFSFLLPLFSPSSPPPPPHPSLLSPYPLPPPFSLLPSLPFMQASSQCLAMMIANADKLFMVCLPVCLSACVSVCVSVFSSRQPFTHLQEVSIKNWGKWNSMSNSSQYRKQPPLQYGFQSQLYLHKSQKVFWKKTSTCRDGSLKNQPN